MKYESRTHFLIDLESYTMYVHKIIAKIIKSHNLLVISFMHAMNFVKKQAHGSSTTLHPAFL